MKTILVVDDEPTLVATLKYNLERDGHRILTAADGESALRVAREGHPDLIVLDLMMPVMNGLEVCRMIRRETDVPILILTARDSEIDKVVGLELGADDYVTKPFGMQELVARVRALLRRSQKAPPADTPLMVAGDISVDSRSRVATRRQVPLALKPKEFELLRFFIKNKGQAFTRDQLLSQIWGYDFAGDTRTVDVHVHWLRQKIEEDPATPFRLITVRGLGYRFDG